LEIKTAQNEAFTHFLFQQLFQGLNFANRDSLKKNAFYQLTSAFYIIQNQINLWFKINHKL